MAEALDLRSGEKRTALCASVFPVTKRFSIFFTVPETDACTGTDTGESEEAITCPRRTGSPSRTTGALGAPPCVTGMHTVREGGNAASTGSPSVRSFRSGGWTPPRKVFRFIF